LLLIWFDSFFLFCFVLFCRSFGNPSLHYVAVWSSRWERTKTSIARCC
jgi:hypothetical protein